MIITFDDSGTIPNPEVQLVGKTIARIIPRGIPDGIPETWVLEFTDGDRVELRAHYDDSEVFFMRPRE